MTVIRPKKLLFCDWDGVLNSAKFYERRAQLRNEGKITLAPARLEDHFDRDAIDRLNLIIDSTGCFIVVTSGHRNTFKTVEDLRAFAASIGIRSDAVWDRTPVRAWRSQEVSDYLATFGKLESWAVVDDAFGPLDGFDESRVVFTDKQTGLLDVHVDELVRILNNWC